MDSVAINMDENSIPREHIASLMIDSQLHKCVRQDNIDYFKSRVQTLSAEELVTPTGNSLLHVAVSYGSDKITSYLAETFPSLITAQNSQEDTVLHLAARRGKDSDAIKSLAQSNPRLMRKANTKGNTPLHDAVINGYEEIARFLASKDPEVVYYNNNSGKSPLYLAVENDKKNGILDDLLKSGASNHIKREDGDALPKGKSPVHAAIKQRDKDILVRIEKAKPELLRLTDEELGNSLHYASSIGFPRGVQFLLDKFLDGAYERNREENYPIHIACKNDSVCVVKKYLDRFPYPEEFLNKKGQNILHVAAKYGKDRVVSYILRQEDRLVKSLVNEMDEDGNTPLHLAAGSGRSLASFLLVRDNRVGRFIVNNRNWTPFDFAQRQSKSAVEQFDKANEMLAKEQEISENSNPSKMLDGRDNSKDVEDGMTNSTAENSTDGTSSERKDKAKRDTEKASPKQEGMIDFLETATTFSILYFHALPKYFSTDIPRPISHAKEESNSSIGNLLVVAVLVAGVTFAGAVQLPQLRDNSKSREQHHESNSTVTASYYSSYENLLYYYLCFDVGALSTSIVAALILLWANFIDARFILLAVKISGFMVFYSINLMFGAFLSSVSIALLGSSEVWSIAITVVAVVFYFVLAFLFLPWILPRTVNQILQRILLCSWYYQFFIMFFYIWRWLPEKLADLKKKLKHPH
ncbi:ANKYRIN REPEAT PROTEIN-LIKE [Salix koriyanagi]|uniref:ANKYRIN REPEAT PROTEIN-LIKE n=1 Tax=Salix koriyanagi TaxID=2511006 RepID=A0A9Q1A4Z1_9ROSI|nr:ANKYRIN REPEAT PROTEIN-LIKE [Salix koriyanagi]